MYIMDNVKTDDDEFSAAAFIGDWLLAHDDNLGDRARYKAKATITDPGGKIVGVVAEVDGKTRMLMNDE